jgi:hypothetical protein
MLEIVVKFKKSRIITAIVVKKKNAARGAFKVVLQQLSQPGTSSSLDDT